MVHLWYRSYSTTVRIEHIPYKNHTMRTSKKAATAAAGTTSKTDLKNDADDHVSVKDSEIAEQQRGQQGWGPYDVYALVYVAYPLFCCYLLFLDAGLGYNRAAVWNGRGYCWSVTYFAVDVVYYALLRAGSILHHLACLSLLALRLIWANGDSYAEFMHVGLVMELSNLPLAMRKYVEKGSRASQCNDLLFVALWVGSRLCYSLPVGLEMVHDPRNFGDGATYLASRAATYLIAVLHVYWGYLISRKTYRAVAGSSRRWRLVTKEE